jgi:hypothetical protein
MNLTIPECSGLNIASVVLAVISLPTWQFKDSALCPMKHARGTPGHLCYVLLVQLRHCTKITTLRRSTKPISPSFAPLSRRMNLKKHTSMSMQFCRRHDSALPCLAPHEFLSSLGRQSLGICPLSYPFRSSIQLWCRPGLAWSCMNDTLPRRSI